MGTHTWGSLNAGNRTTIGFSTTWGEVNVVQFFYLLPALCVQPHSQPCCAAQRREWRVPGASLHSQAGKTTCPLPSGPIRTGSHTAEPWRELCQTLGVKAAGLRQLQALQMLLKNLPPFLPKTGRRTQVWVSTSATQIGATREALSGVSSSLITTIVCETNLELQAALQNEKEK